MTSRRTFFKAAAGATLAAWTANPLWTWAADANSGLVVPGKDSLIVRSYRFVDLETPVEYFNTLADAGPALLRAQSHARADRSGRR